MLSGSSPAVGFRPGQPRVGVLQDPLAVALLAGEQERVGDQAGDAQVTGDVAAPHALLHHLAHAARQLRIAQVVVGGDAGHVVIGKAVAGHPGRPAVARFGVTQAPSRPAGTVVRGADQPPLAVIVGCLRVRPEVEPGEAFRPLAQQRVAGVGQAQGIEVDVALRLVELVVAQLVLAREHAVGGELPGHGVPLPVAQWQQAVAAAEQVVQRPVAEALVEVVGAVAAGVPLGRGVAPDQGAVGVRVLVQERIDRRVQQVEQPPLQHRPGGELRVRRGGGDGGHDPLLTVTLRAIRCGSCPRGRTPPRRC